MIRVDDGTEEGIKTFTDRRVQCLQELIADIRTSHGGTGQFLRDETCEADVSNASWLTRKTDKFSLAHGRDAKNDQHALGAARSIRA
jgi:hypothetical protein